MTAWHLRMAVSIGAPVATALVIVQHPPDPTDAGGLGDQTDPYIAIHVALLMVLPFLGMTVWFLLHGLRGAAATVSRVAIPFMLVFYAAFDALVGIGAGVLAREALAVEGSHQAGARVLAARWMEIPPPLPIVGALGPISWTVALGAAASTHGRSPRSSVSDRSEPPLRRVARESRR